MVNGWMNHRHRLMFSYYMSSANFVDVRQIQSSEKKKKTSNKRTQKIKWKMTKSIWKLKQKQKFYKIY